MLSALGLGWVQSPAVAVGVLALITSLKGINGGGGYQLGVLVRRAAPQPLIAVPASALGRRLASRSAPAAAGLRAQFLVRERVDTQIRQIVCMHFLASSTPIGGGGGGGGCVRC